MCRGFSMNQPRCSWYNSIEDKCGYWIPDGWASCVGRKNCGIYLEELKENDEMAGTIMIEGVGQDAEIVVNEKGGKQSKSPMAMHLVDPNFLKQWADDKVTELQYMDSNHSITVDEADKEKYNCYRAIEHIARYMIESLGELEKCYLSYAMDSLERDSITQIIKIAKVLQYGADRYKANNWRLIPQEEHINHALTHIIAHLAGDTQDDHIDHALCRLMMAYATEKSDSFEYGAYVE